MAGFEAPTDGPAAAGNRSGRWTVLAIALATQTATSIVAFALPVLLPFVKSDLHLTFAQAGLLANFAFLGVMLTTAVAGWAVDAVGDRFVLVAGAFVTGSAAVACGLAPSLAILLATLLMMGGGIGTATPAGSIAVRSAFPRRLRGTVMGIRQTGVPLGTFLGALILPWIALRGGWREALEVAGAATVVMAVLTRFIYQPGPRSGGGDWRSVGLMNALTRDVAVAGVVGLLLFGAQVTVVTYLVAFLIQDWGINLIAAGAFLAAANLAGGAGRLLWGLISDRPLKGSRRHAIVLAAATGALGSVWLALLPSGAPLPVLVLGILVCAGGAIGWNGVQISLLSELVEPGVEGRAVGMGLMIQQPGIFVGPFVFGLVIDVTHSFRAAWLLLVAYFALATLLVFAVRERPRGIAATQSR